MKMTKIYISISMMVALFLVPLYGQQATRAQLAEALAGCEQDLDTARRQISQLQAALQNSNELIGRRQQISDSLLANLRLQLVLQDSVQALFTANNDTLQKMVVDYREKLNQIDALYIKELKEKSRPWYLTWKGLQGLSYGLFSGAAIGLLYGLSR